MVQLVRSDLEEFNDIIGEYLKHPDIKKMQDYCAHGDVSVLKHSLNVAKMAYYINKKYKLKANGKTLLIGALLHDFYLYDWHDKKLNINIFKMHGYTHPMKACDNAIRVFNIDEDIQKVISSHMWPLTFRSFPSSKEAMIVCLADKICALMESFHYDK